MPKASKSPEKPVANAVRSMTGFGRVERSDADGRVCAEIRSVNGRFLKLSVKLPPRLGAFEDKIKTLLAERGVRRGSVDVMLFVETAGASENGYEINAAAVKAYAKQAKAVGKALGIKGGLTLQSLLGLPGVVGRAESTEDLDAAWARCEKALNEALDRFDEMRVKEGAALVQDVRARLNEMRAHRDALAVSAPEALNRNVVKFKERVEKLLQKAGIDQPLDKEILEREIVLASDRMDISEELARLDSHFAQMDAALADGAEVGKKLDFLTQELFRETNTVGSKANDQSITHRVVDMKNLIEKIREQVQNLE
ncbi:MAG: YicC family protein [Planctomycetota bacterium]|nr:YicC family protein [Planctomycetota bacterium]